MTEKGDKFVDRTESYLSDEERGKVSKGKTATIPAHISIESGVSTEIANTEKRVSTTTWNISKTTVITDNVTTTDKTSTMELSVSNSGFVSPVKKSFMSSTEFGVNQKPGNMFDDEFVLIEKDGEKFVDRSESKQIEQHEKTQGPKKTYFAHLLEQKSEGDYINSVGSKPEIDDALYEGITYTPGIAIRSYAQEEMNNKRRPEIEDAINNNSGSIAATDAFEDNSQQELSPAATYRIARIFSGEEVDPWEEEKRRKERDEFAIIDTLSMDDMMKMLGEHDRQQQALKEDDNQEVFPIAPGTLTSEFKDYKSSDAEKVSQDGQEKSKRENLNNSASEKDDLEEGPEASRKEQAKSGISSIQHQTSKEEKSNSTDSPAFIEIGNSVKLQETLYSTSYIEGSREGVTEFLASSLFTEQVSKETVVLEAPVETTPEKETEVKVGSPQEDIQVIPEVLIEVERKFNITKETENKIKALGGKLLKERSFKDIYYDNADYKLTLSDSWLRKRDASWEVKDASEGNGSRNFVTHYREITDEGEIVKFITEKLNLTSKFVKVDEIVRSDDLTEFATISTIRKSYRLFDCTIDLDLCDHGFQVGEIEVMASSVSKVSLALQTLNNVAKKLGVSLLKLT